jgi:hypothetical protein
MTSDLELFSTQELLDEVVRRATFLGVIVHADSVKDRSWDGERTFKVRYNENLGRQETGRLLSVVADHIQFSSFTEDEE